MIHESPKDCYERIVSFWYNLDFLYNLNNVVGYEFQEYQFSFFQFFLKNF